MVEQQKPAANRLQPVKENSRGYVSISDFLNANQHLLDEENARQKHIQVKQQRQEGQQPSRGVHFNEDEIQAYDLQRGQCQPIDDPKTPFHEEVSDEEMDVQADGTPAADIQLDPLTETNLGQAQQNRQLNAQTCSGVVRQTPTQFASAASGEA